MPEPLARRAVPVRRRLPLTPLIDVIFLLLMFFMLATRFDRPAEFPLDLAGAGAGPAQVRPLFLRLGPETAELNGLPVDLADLGPALAAAGAEAGAPVVLALAGGLAAQRLADALAALRGAGHPAVVLR